MQINRVVKRGKIKNLPARTGLKSGEIDPDGGRGGTRQGRAEKITDHRFSRKDDFTQGARPWLTIGENKKGPLRMSLVCGKVQGERVPNKT